MASFFKALKKHWLLWLSLSAFAVLFGFLAVEEFQRWFSLRQELSQREQEIRVLEQEAQELNVRLEQVSNPAFLEKEARRRLNLKAEDEQVFVVVGIEDISEPEDFSSVFGEEEKTYSPLTRNILAWYQYFIQ